MGFSFKQMFTPPKSIRKFQPKKAGNIDWWKDVGKEVGIPAAALLATGGLAGIGPLGGALGGAGGAIGGLASKAGGLSSLASGAGGTAGGGNLLQRALGFAKGNPELLLGGLDAVLNARRGAESDKLRDLGVDQMKLQNRTRSDLLGRALGLDPNAPNPSLSGIFSDPSNPFAARGGGRTGLPPRRTGTPQPDPSIVDASGVGGLGSEAEARRRMGLPPKKSKTLRRATGGPRQRVT